MRLTTWYRPSHHASGTSTSTSWPPGVGHHRNTSSRRGPLDPDSVHFSEVWLYPTGEVLYVVYLLDGTQVEIEDVLAELP